MVCYCARICIALFSDWEGSSKVWQWGSRQLLVPFRYLSNQGWVCGDLHWDRRASGMTFWRLLAGPT